MRCELCHYFSNFSRPSFFTRKVQDFGVPKLIFDPRAFAFVAESLAQRLWGQDYLKFRHADLFLGGPALPPEVVSARLNFWARGPKNLLLHGKNQACRALYYWPACQNLGVPYPKWMSCKCALRLELQFVRVPALSQRFLVRGRCFVEEDLIRWNAR